MKNISEVSSIDLGKPFSSYSQISVNEPESEYIQINKQLIRKDNKINQIKYQTTLFLNFNPNIYNLKDLDLLDQYIDKVLDDRNNLELYPIAWAKAQITHHKQLYNIHYIPLKSDPMEVNQLIYSHVIVNKLYSNTAEQIGLKLPNSKDNLNPKTAYLSDKPTNFYQIQLCDLANQNGKLLYDQQQNVCQQENLLNLLFYMIDNIKNDLMIILKHFQYILGIVNQLSDINKENSYFQDFVDIIQNILEIKDSGFNYVWLFYKNYKKLVNNRNPAIYANKRIEELIKVLKSGQQAKITPDFIILLLECQYSINNYIKSDENIYRNVQNDNEMYDSDYISRFLIPFLQQEDPKIQFGLFVNLFQNYTDIQVKKDIRHNFKQNHFNLNIKNVIQSYMQNQQANLIADLQNIQDILKNPFQDQILPPTNQKQQHLLNGIQAYIRYVIYIINEGKDIKTTQMQLKSIQKEIKNGIETENIVDYDLDSQIVIQNKTDKKKTHEIQVDNTRQQVIDKILKEITNQFVIFGEINERIKHVIEQIKDNSTQLQNTVVVSSPTGTGKTMQYMLYIATLPRQQLEQYKNAPHSIVFTSNSSLSMQIFDTFRTHLKESITVVTEGKVGDSAVLNIKTSYSGMMHGYDNVQVYMNSIKECKVKVIDGHSYSYQIPHEKKSRLIYQKRIQRQFGGILIAPLYLYEFLFASGVIDDFTSFQTVVFDEIDVFYNVQSIPEFHQFFFQHPSIYKAHNILFCSATISSDFIQKYDAQLSQSSSKFMWSQFINNSGQKESIFGASTNPNIDNNMITNTIDKYIYLNYNDYVQINNDDYVLYRKYGNIRNQADSTAVIERILKYNPLSITSNYPLYQFKQKEIIKQQYQYILPIKEFIPLINITDTNIESQADLKQFTQLIIDNANQIIQKNNGKEVYDTFKYQFFGIDYLINENQAHMHLIQAYTSNRKQYDELDIAYAKSLFLYFKDDQIYQTMLQFQNMNIFHKIKNIQFEEVFQQNTQTIPKIKNELMNSQSPFYIQLINQYRLSNNEAKTDLILGTADIYQGGRGLDISGLIHVYILIPMYINLAELSVTYNFIKQAVGRVGRAGLVGNAHIVKLMYKDCPDESSFDAFCDSIAIPEIKLSYNNIKYEGYLKNKVLIDDIVQQLQADFPDHL